MHCGCFLSVCDFSFDNWFVQYGVIGDFFFLKKSSITQVNIHVSLVCNKKKNIYIYFDSPSVGEAAAAAVLDKSECAKTV